VAFILFRAPKPPIITPLLGTWTNLAPLQQNGLAKLEINTNGDRAVAIHAWGECGQAQCDWGSKPGNFDGQQVHTTWQFGADGSGNAAKRTADVSIKPDNGQLSVTVSNSYSDHPSNQHTFVFAKANPAAGQAPDSGPSR
jgi:hypothetical protein